MALCRDNELIMGIGKQRGIANYGVNAVERNRGSEIEQQPPSGENVLMVCTSAPARPCGQTRVRVRKSFNTHMQNHVGKQRGTCAKNMNI